MTDPQPILHKRGYIGEESVAVCGADVPLDEMRTDWKRVNCPKCLLRYRPRKQKQEETTK